MKITIKNLIIIAVALIALIAHLFLPYVSAYGISYSLYDFICGSFKASGLDELFAYVVIITLILIMICAIFGGKTLMIIAGLWCVGAEGWGIIFKKNLAYAGSGMWIVLICSILEFVLIVKSIPAWEKPIKKLRKN